MTATQPPIWHLVQPQADTEFAAHFVHPQAFGYPVIAVYRKNAVQQVRDGFYALAVGSLTSALALLPNSVELLTERAVLHICSGDPAAAELDTSMALALDDSSADATYFRAQARNRTGNIWGAEADWHRCLLLARLQENEALTVMTEQDLVGAEEYVADIERWRAMTGEAGYMKMRAEIQEASAAREAQAAEMAKEALAQGAFLAWQRFSAFARRQQEAVSFTAAEDVSTVAPLRIEATCAKGDSPPDSPRSVASGLLSEASSRPDSPRHAAEDSTADVIHAEVAASWPSTERCHRGLPDAQLLAIEEALSDQPNDPVMRLARAAHRLCTGDMHAAVMGHLQIFLAGPRDDASLEGTAAACEACAARHAGLAAQAHAAAELAACSSTAAAPKLALAALQPEADVKGSSSAPISAPAAATARPAKINEKRRGKKKGPGQRRENRVMIHY
ncbi:hypothetical protein COCSUDRAFT_56221 [Coccomyxa subellipsoidea C-169]|uniref:Uncharacterized protein n=1 Tax=Coccomyxa subellipsoidea (strain C-169) TaxID=574566 RepID=I0YTQ5_COCSC|nr:hypothetical protein COCSUDRAFT_56221 [Coccomyxa subellipsoidea C-169]EIE21774.1 hypothetical protein COCSUDRAFT_56221 [Coccomyxa subellipsoidea C-169]|eukprot:XP_005646318.1 hypothetical protein COCSUDRAFT_56221 [Coccomyxa subellipsoidea C-169]